MHYNILLRFCIQPCFVFYAFQQLKIKKSEYHNIITGIYYSDGEVSSQCDASSSVQENLQKRLAYLGNSNITLGQMFLILFDVLQEFLLFIANEKSSPSQVSAITDPLIDVNNNDLPTINTCDIKQHDFNAGTTKDLGNNNHITMIWNLFTSTNECIHKSVYTCNNFKNFCYANLESDPCCTSYSVPSTAVFFKNCNLACKKISTTIPTRDIGLSMKDTFDTTSFPTNYEKCRKSSYRDISKDFCVSNCNSPPWSIKL